MHDTLDADRDNDRRLRAQLDPLIGDLSPLGKFELGTRLIGESMVDGVRRRRPLDMQPQAIPVRVVRVIEPARKEEGEREEAPGGSGSPLPDSMTTQHDDTKEEAPNGIEE